MSDVGFKLALDRLRNFVANAPDPSKGGGNELAYALYVLARNGVAPVGDLRYVADTKLDAISTPIAKAQIAAALGMLGDKVRAERVYAAAVASIVPPARRRIWPRRLRLVAARFARRWSRSPAEGSAPQATVMNAVARIETARAAVNYTSTQENAWMVLAARALGKEDAAATARRRRNARPCAVPHVPRRRHSGGRHQGAENLGDAPLQAVVSVSGAPIVPEPAAERGFRIERTYYTLAGEQGRSGSR